MPKRPLPKILEREPLVEALFEVRMSGTPLIVEVVPGILFHELEPKPQLMRLATADLPQQMRAADPGLQYAPLLRLDWGQYVISLGDRSVVIGCKLPYPKWPNFKAAILDITSRIAKVGLGGKVERYSLKYVNLIQAPTLAEQIAKIRMSVTLGDVAATDDNASVQVHRHENGILHILSVIIGAQGKLADGRAVFGAVVDIDSIRNVDVPDFATFATGLEPGLEDLRQANKVKFFDCLTDLAIKEMGPIYG